MKRVDTLQTQLNVTRLRQLLRASFLNGEAALEEFRAWNAQIDWNGHLNADEYRLLPQLYRNLSAQQFPLPQLVKFKGIARKAWYSNTLFLHRLAPDLNALRAANLQPLLLYGGAFALRYDSDYAFTDGSACGILMRSSDARPAFQQLARLGWHATPPIAEAVLENYLKARYAHLFQNEQGARLVLQWQLFPHCARKDTDAEFWTRAQVTPVDDVPVFTLEPTDQLIHTLVFGATARGTTPWQRAIDAMLLLTNTPARINWQEFLARIQTLRLTLPVREVLLALAQDFELPVPPLFLEKIKTLPVSAEEQREANLWNAATPGERVTQLWYIARRRSCDAAAWRFPIFLQYWWGLEHPTQLPARGASSLFSALRRRI